MPIRHVIAALVLVVCTTPEVHAQGGFIPPASPELIATILQKDRELFDAVFKVCNPVALAPLVADDFEFYHDKWGQVADSGSQWVQSVAGMCERQRLGTDYRARRELDSASTVYPMKTYGAIHMGVHRFYKLLPDGKEQLVEISRFTNLWKNENGAWKLTRVLSYDHREVKP